MGAPATLGPSKYHPVLLIKGQTWSFRRGEPLNEPGDSRARPGPLLWGRELRALLEQNLPLLMNPDSFQTADGVLLLLMRVDLFCFDQLLSPHPARV